MDERKRRTKQKPGSTEGQDEVRPPNSGFFAARNRDARNRAGKMHPAETPTHASDEEAQGSQQHAPPDHVHLASQKTSVRKHHSLIDKVYMWENLWKAWRKVRRNKGAHGLDRVTIKAFEQDAEMHLRTLQRQLMQDRYVPIAARRVYIPKTSDPAQLRPLGIPTVTDRVCQQAVLQVLSPKIDPDFSPRSLGFRANRRAHDAIAILLQDAKEGYRHVLDADIASFFDRLDHEVVMSHVRQKIADGRVIRLIEAFLKAGFSENNVVTIPTEGSPQGGVISPFIANLVLDTFDKAVEAKGFRHVRYADDFVILTKSREEAQDALRLAKEVLGNLKLSLHETKTRLTDMRTGFEFLGFRLRSYRLSVREKSAERFKDKIRQLTRRQQGRNVDAVIKDLNPVLRGFARYFGPAEVRKAFELMDSWVRMRVRSFRTRRRCHNDNWRLPDKKLNKWGLLSLLECRPALRLSYRCATP